MSQRFNISKIIVLCLFVSIFSTSYSIASEIKEPSVDNDIYKCYSTADQMRESNDLRYGGPRSRFYLTPEEVTDYIMKSTNGNGDAAFKLSQYYEMIKSDSEKGFIWLKKAAEMGSPNAQYNLGARYSLDSPIKNEELSNYWFTKAADSGDITAKIKLGRQLSKEEVGILSEKGDEGDQHSAYLLSTYYKNVEKNNILAEYWRLRFNRIPHEQAIEESGANLEEIE